MIKTWKPRWKNDKITKSLTSRVRVAEILIITHLLMLNSELSPAACDALLMFHFELPQVTLWAGVDAMLRIFSCDLKLARLEDVVTLQDSWHLARCLKRFTTLSTDDRVIIFGGEWGSVAGGGGVGRRWWWETFVWHTITLSTKDRAIMFWVGGKGGKVGWGEEGNF